MPDPIKVRTNSRFEMLNITRQIQDHVSKSGVTDGIVVVYQPHTTAGITINKSADPDVCRDILFHTKEMVPNRREFHHAEGNSDSHILASLFGTNVTVIVENGKLQLGTWQGIFFCEFDGPRNRQVWLKIISS